MSTQNLSHSRTGPIRRLSSIDATLAGAIFDAALTLLVPDDVSQRKAFEGLMPFLYVLRNKGCSWPQLNKLLTDAGFVLQPSTVRTYYSEMLASRLDICQSRMNEQILLLAELRKQTQVVKIADIEARAAAVMAQQKDQVAAKLNAVFGAIPAASAVSVVVQDSPQVENSKTGLRPVPVDATPGGALLAADNILDAGLGGAALAPAATVVPAFQVRPAGTVAFLEAKTEAAPPPPAVHSDAWVCNPLPADVKLLDRRDGVPDEVYLPGDLAHPAVPGVLLTRDQRLSTVALEFVNSADGEIRLENSTEKLLRVRWRAPIPPAKTRTGGDFTVMDLSLFKKK
jgi:hypothetical protein